jgi:predicted ArsR family transcriptional regulator
VERIKVLAAALALREFTADDIAELTGVKPHTVRNVLNRSPDVVRRLPSKSPGRRGRPTTGWATSDTQAVRELTADLAQLRQMTRHLQ